MTKTTDVDLGQINYSAFDLKVSPKIVYKMYISSAKTQDIIWSIAIVAAFAFIFVTILVQSINYGSFKLLFRSGSLILLGILSLMLSQPLLLIYRKIVDIRNNYRLEKFSEDNRFTCVFKGFPKSATKSGLVFGVGTDNRYDSVVDMDFATFGRYSYLTGAGSSNKVNKILVANMKLNRKFPHLVFDNKKNNYFMSNLPSYFSSNQKVSLEGNFDDHFITYIPKNYQIDVLSFVTPELMEKLIQYGGKYDIEVIDDELYLYAEHEIDYKNDIRDFSLAITEIAKEFNQNAKHYRDDRVVKLGASVNEKSNSISKEGMRLNKTIKPALLIFIVFIIYIFANVFISKKISTLSYLIIVILLISLPTLFKIYKNLKK